MNKSNQYGRGWLPRNLKELYRAIWMKRVGELLERYLLIAKRIPVKETEDDSSLK